MNTRTKILSAAAVAVALTGGIGATIATADTPTPAPSPSSSATGTPEKTPANPDKQAQHKKRALATRALHGEATLGGKKHRVVEFQRGAVTKVSSTSITVTSTDGFAATYVVDDKTKVHRDKAVAKIADVKTADRVRVVATKDGATVTANAIRDAGPKR